MENPHLFFYSWGELKDLYEPYTLCYGRFVSEEHFPHGKVTELLNEDCKKFIKEYKPDFAFLYLETTDSIGHESGYAAKNIIKPLSILSVLSKK